jgi:hypothetical protein
MSILLAESALKAKDARESAVRADLMVRPLKITNTRAAISVQKN